MNYRLSPHAEIQRKARKISMAQIDAVLQNPGQIVAGYFGRNVYQSQIVSAKGKTFLLRVVVIDSLDPAIVVSIYLTDKVAKYWR